MKDHFARSLSDPVLKLAAFNFLQQVSDFKGLFYHLCSLEGFSVGSEVDCGQSVESLDSTVSEVTTVVEGDQSVCSVSDQSACSMSDQSVVSSVDHSVSCSSSAVFIGNLPRSMTRRKLRDILRKRGNIVKIWRSSTRNFAFVTFSSSAAASRALNLNGRVVGNRRLKVKLKHPPSKHGCQSGVKAEVKVEFEKNLQLLTSHLQLQTSIYKRMFSSSSSSAVT